MTCLRIALLCLAIVPGSFSNYDIHKFMSPEEVQQVFHASSVPKYEIVKVDFTERLHKRDLPARNKMHIRAFGRDINLWLHPTESILAGVDTPVYYARNSSSKPGGVEYWHWKGMMQMVGKIFEDPYTLASFVIGKENSGRTRVNGFIDSERMVVRSLPSRVAEEYRRRRRSVGDFDDFNSPYHVVFETNKTYTENYTEIPVNETVLQKKGSQYASGKPYTLYPEILVVVEYSINSLMERLMRFEPFDCKRERSGMLKYKWGPYEPRTIRCWHAQKVYPCRVKSKICTEFTGKTELEDYVNDVYGLLEYLLAFWNGVDLKYRSLERPRVRFHISGIVLAQDSGATPYISNNSVGIDVFESTAAMAESSKFYYTVRDTFPFDSYDITVTMTKQLFGLEAQARVLGKAWLGTACERHEKWESTYAVTIIQDNGAFSGVFVAAHELGHILGSPHDTSGENCAYNNGFLMSFTPWYTKNSSDFSTCSVQAFDEHLRDSKLDCLFNRPQSPGQMLPKLMPGRMKNLEEQCRGLEMGAPCQDKSATPDVCVNIYCLNEHGECKETGTAAVDGTSCGNNNEFCLHMQCVSL